MKTLYKVAFTGHRPNKIGGYNPADPKRVAVRAAIKSALQRAIAKFVDMEVVVISGGALGVDTDAASVAHELGLRFMVAAPCRGQDSKWPSESKKRYANMCKAASDELAQTLATSGETVQGGVVFVHDGSYNGTCMQDRNEWMVDHCDALVAIWDGSGGGTGNCVNYAVKVKKAIVRINPSEL